MSGSSAPYETRQRQVRQHAEANAIMRDAWEEGSTFDDDERLIELLDNNDLHGNEITLKNICDLHRKIAGNTYWAGKFRERNVAVGDFLIPTGPAEVPGKMRDLVVWINEQEKLNSQGQGMGIIWLATHAMHKLSILHPFSDCNGRLSRLVMNLLLNRAGFGPICFPKEAQDDYYDILVEASRGNTRPIDLFMTQWIQCRAERR
uniref:Fido domain-containing protein n=1 Tax=Globodera rostochiensis TaxID=31243 RepID=A0A914GXB5_GLORO